MKKTYNKPSCDRIPCDLSNIQGYLSDLPESELLELLRQNGVLPERRMIASQDYILREIAGEAVLVSVGGGVVDFCGIVTLNPTARALWKRLEQGATEAELTGALQEQFAVSGEQAAADVHAALQLLSERGLVKNV